MRKPGRPQTRHESAPYCTQADVIIALFGGVYKLASAIGRRPSVIYRWTYNVDRDGTNGRVPDEALDAIKLAAILEGIKLPLEALHPVEKKEQKDEIA